VGYTVQVSFRNTGEHADAPHALGLLRVRCKRPPSRRATQNTEKLPPPHIHPPGSGDGIVTVRLRTLIGAETAFATAIWMLADVSDGSLTD
jgi:hypothetical protein